MTELFRINRTNRAIGREIICDFFKNNPIALRHCMLYIHIRNNEIEKRFSTLRHMIGRCVIKEEFEDVFKQFEQGLFDDKEPITDMEDVIRKDKHALRACVLYECLKHDQAISLLPDQAISLLMWPDSEVPFEKLQSDPPFFIYNSFCKVIGEDAMEYREFEFWFYRFYRFLNPTYNQFDLQVPDEFDLIYEREEDKKVYELTDMPDIVMKKVVENLDVFDRVKLAKTSRELRTFVKDQKLFHHTLKLHISRSMATVSFSKLIYMEYNKNGRDCEKHFKQRETIFLGVSYWKQAFLDLKKLLENAKLYLTNLEINLDMLAPEIKIDFWEDVLKFTHYLNVQNVFFVGCSWKLLAKILPFLKPGYLTTIDIDSPNSNSDVMGKVLELEQWKQAKFYKMKGAFFIWPLSNLYHFKGFTVSLKEFSLDDVREMKKILFNSPDFERCLLNIQDDTLDFEQAFGNALRESSFIYHYPAPDSTEYFEIKVEDQFEVTRMKR